MPESITCLEHNSLPVVKHRKHGQQALGRRHTELLSKLKTNLPENSVKWMHKKIKFSQFCGIIQLGDLTVEILPKIYGLEDNPGSCREALINMLDKVRFFKTHKSILANIDLQRHSLLEVFILHFCHELKAQVVQGKPRSYVFFEENLNVLRGRLQLDHQIKQNLVHKERLYCRYEELSENIAINQIIKYTLCLLLPLCQSSKGRKLVSELLMLFDGISDGQVTTETFGRLHIDRTNARYEPIIEQCRIFVEGLYPHVLAGTSKGPSLLFDMNSLFEAWVAAIFRPEAKRQNLTLKQHGPQKYLALRKDTDIKAFRLEPDISLSDSSDAVVLIADSKWKRLNPNSSTLGISPSDIYQVQNYSNRYGVKDVMLIYPRQKGLDGSYKMELQGKYRSNLEIRTIDIAKPDSDPMDFSFFTTQPET